MILVVYEYGHDAYGVKNNNLAKYHICIKHKGSIENEARSVINIIGKISTWS